MFFFIPIKYNLIMEKTSAIYNTTTSSTRIEELERENEKLRAQIAWLESQFRLSKHRQYGVSSEKTPSGQLELPLFNEPEVLASSSSILTDEEGSIDDKDTKAPKKARLSFSEDLPVKIVTYRLPEEEQVCPCCGGGVHVMSVESRREILIIPATVEIIEHKREIYGCRKCEREGIETPILSADVPRSPITKSMASPSALAFIFNQKYGAAMPLYRLEEQLAQIGAPISRQTLSNWIMKGTELWISPIYELMRKIALEESVLHADETTVQVIREDGRPATSKSYMWMYRTGRTAPPCILYDYQTTRAAKHPMKFLKDFSGKLHVDGYVGYEAIPKITLSGCWAHARRAFMDAKKSASPGSADKLTLTDEAIQRIASLYGIEKEIAAHEGSIEEEYVDFRLKTRQEKSLPLVRDFFMWLKIIRPQVLPKSPLGRAITYVLNQEKKLIQPFEDGRLDLDNNLAERSIKPFVIGRKNWLFSNTPRGATSSAMAYSLLVTAKENDLNIYSYLTHLFSVLPNIDITNLEELVKHLPWSKELPSDCYLNE